MSTSKIFHLWQKPIRLSMFILLFSIWLTLSLNVLFFQKLYALTPYGGLSALGFIVVMVIVLIAYFNLIFNLLMWRPTAKFFAIFFLLIGGAASYVNSLGVGIDAYQIQNLVETDPREAMDLMSSQVLLWIVVLLAVPLMFFLPINIRKDNISTTIKSKLIMLVVSFAVLASGTFMYYADLAAIFREHRDLKSFISPQNVVASSWSYYKKLQPKKNLPLVAYGVDADQVKTARQNTAKLLVLVIGETARAESFSLNGYARNTNPELSELSIINFSQVSSCGTSTAVSVPCMFSGMQRADYDAKLAPHRENLLDILQRAGYKVTWIDNNSGCKEVCNRVEQYQPSKALQDKWCEDGECYDEILNDTLKEYVHQIPADDRQPRVIVLHQMGSHGPAYFKRSTAPYQYFKPFCQSNAIQGCTPQELINVYDNSIAYTDHVLAQTIDTLAQFKQYQTAMWYLSDHGESTGEHGLYLHGAPYMMAPSQQTHVPMILWFSPAWQAEHAQDVQCLNRIKQQALSQDHLFSTVMSLLHVDTQVKSKQYDLLQQCHQVNA